MLATVKSFLQDTCGFTTAQTIVVGVSGGPDSMCLLDILHRLEYPVVIAHLDHSLRPESGLDADYVKSIAEKFSVPFVTQRDRVKEYAKESGLSIEEAARERRYRFLFLEAERRDAQAVAVGHNADDQVETVLMHLLRGTGIDGLQGMQPRILLPSFHEKVPLVRPLLNHWQEDILSYCQNRELKPLIDPSNFDKTFLRNRIRHELIPMLESYNPQLREAIQRMTTSLAGDLEIVERGLAAVWEEARFENGADYVSLRRTAIANLALGLQRRVVREAIIQLRPDLRNVGFDAIERAVAFIQKPAPSGQLDLATGLRIVLEGDIVWLVEGDNQIPLQNWPQLPPQTTMLVEVPGRCEFPTGWVFLSELIPDAGVARRQAQKSTNPFQAWVDVGTLTLPLELRTRRSGDRFKPFGMAGQSQKLSDFMINEKMPQRARDQWPLLLSSADIVWVPGYRLADPFRVSEKTHQVVRFWLKKIRDK